MDLRFRGWSRDCGAWSIAESELSLADRRNPSSYKPGRTYMYENSQGELLIEQKAAPLTLNGNYLVSLKLSKADIAAIARTAFRDTPFSEVLALMSSEA